MKRLVFAALLIAGVATAGGCLVVSGTSIDERGTAISSQTLRQVEPGVTTEAWVRAVLGEPSDEQCVGEASERKILRYDHTVTVSEGGVVFLIFAGASESRETKSVYFEVTEGLVTRYWTEP